MQHPWLQENVKSSNENFNLFLQSSKVFWQMIRGELQNMAEKHILGFPVVFSSQRSSALFVPSGHTVKLDFPKPDISFFSSLHCMELGALAALKLLVVVPRRLGRTRLSLHLDGQAVELGEDTARPQTPCALRKDQIP